MKRRLINCFTSLFLMFFMIMVFNVIILNTNTQFKYNMGISMLIFIIMVAGMGLIYYIYNKYIYKLNSKLRIFMHIIFWTMVIVLQIIIVINSYFTTDWDCGQIIIAAINLVDSPEKFDIGYYKMFPNNLFLVWIYKNIYIISKYLKYINYQQLLCIINIIFVDLSIIETVLVSREIFEKKLSVIIELISILLLAFIPWILVPYTDTYSAFCGILIFYIYLKLIKEKNNKYKLIYSILIGMILLIGFQIKPTTIIIIIAIFIAHLLFRIKSKNDLLKFVLYTTIIMCSFIASKYLYTNTIANIVINGVDVRDNYDDTIPMTHFLMMGMQYQETENGYTYGCWSQSDYGITQSYIGKDEKVKANIEEIKHRLKDFGIVGYARFIYDKANWILSDGNFYYGGEGEFEVYVPNNGTNVSENIQSYYLRSGSNYSKTAHINQGTWVMILVFIIISSFAKEDEEMKVNIFIIRLTITGIIMFLLLFEARSRYLINHLPFFALLASHGFNVLYISCVSLFDKFKNRKKIKKYVLE